PGAVVGRVFVLDDSRRRVPRRTVSAAVVPAEHERLTGAIAKSIAEIAAIAEQTQREMGPEAAKIFAFHAGMLADASLTRPMHDRIDQERVTAEYAAWAGFRDAAARFASMPDVFKTKVDDVRDLSVRVLRHLLGEQESRLATLDHKAVVVARDLTPS